MQLGTIEVINTLGRYERVVENTEAGLVDATAARVCFLERSYPTLAARRVGEAQLPPNLMDIIAIGQLGLSVGTNGGTTEERMARTIIESKPYRAVCRRIRSACAVVT
jgi:hypothetical protein